MPQNRVQWFLYASDCDLPEDFIAVKTMACEIIVLCEESRENGWIPVLSHELPSIRYSSSAMWETSEASQ
jgi:hypothetical protein